MALGGGTFTVQNKELPGAYINFVSAANATATLSDRGICTMAMELDWGEDGKVFEVTNGDFQKNSLKIFGYPYSHEKLKGLRDLFINAKTLYAYKLGSGGSKAENALAKAACSGVRGNAISVAVEVNADDTQMFDVKTLVDNAVVDTQTAANTADLKPNGFVEWKKEATLSAAAAIPLTGGTNGEITGASHQDYLDKIESYSFNVMGATVTDEPTKKLYAAFNKRLRDEMGIKFQLVLYRCAADYYGTISVKNKAVDDSFDESALVYWVTGAEAGCEVNKSTQNKIYNGEFEVDADYTQNELKKAIKAGEFTFHKVGENIRVLEDINTMVTTSDTEGDIFKDNQTVRVMDQIANDIAVIFNTKYLGVVPNDKAGRVSLWSDIVKHHKQLQDIRAIEDFSEEDVTVEQGDTKKSVVVTDCITAVNAMSKLYMAVTVA